MNLLKYGIPLLILFSAVLYNEYMSTIEGLKGIPGTEPAPRIKTGSSDFTASWAKFSSLLSTISSI